MLRCAACLVLASLVWNEAALADVPVPAAVQAGLLIKVMAFDRQMLSRAPEKARVLLVYKPTASGSESTAVQIRQRLTELGGKVGDKDVEAELLPFESAGALLKSAEARQACVALLSSGFDSAEIRTIASAFEGKNLLTAGAEPATVADGLVLGFDLISGKVKLLVNLQRARRQNVDFDAGFLSMVKVVP